MTELTLEHKLLCDVAAVRAHLDKYSRIEQRALLSRVMDHLNAVVEAQRAALASTPTVGGTAEIDENWAAQTIG